MPAIDPPPQIVHRFLPVFRAFLPPAVAVLEQFPQTIVTSWWRSPAENARVGGHPFSQHLVGWAFDLVAAPGRGGRLKDALVAGQFEVIGESDHIHVQVFKAGILEQLGLDPAA